MVLSSLCGRLGATALFDWDSFSWIASYLTGGQPFAWEVLYQNPYKRKYIISEAGHPPTLVAGIRPDLQLQVENARRREDLHNREPS
jgi:hypothetical protein